ncbi:MAG: alpha/beta hydrolase [Gemmatimonadaceae bacterium]|nr:alpha/beta hydrolase [Gemmatimonadaceae bacterium]
MRTLLAHAFLLAVSTCYAGCHRAVSPERPSPQRTAWVDTLGFRNRLVGTGDTWVHTIDYGGRGPALVFLAGLGNSAHVFDEFAPRFTNAYRVVGLTRRGYGESGRPSDGYDTARLVEDVRIALDSLGITAAVLVGHSVAGDELTGFGARYPARTLGLVYLDAAYDRHGMTAKLVQRFFLNQLPPSAPGPRGDDRKSALGMQAFLERTYGVPWPLTEVHATRRFDADGRYVGDAGAGSTGFKVMRGEEAMAYERLTAPVLAMYATERSVERDYPWIRHMTIGRGFKYMDALRASRAQDRFERGERERLRKALPNARVVELKDASHYVFISHATIVEEEMRRFLESLHPAS